MNETLATAYPWLPVGLGPFLLLLAVPLLATRSRSLVAYVFAGLAVASAVLAVLEGSAPRELEIINMFPQGEDGALEPMVFETSTAPGYAWGLVLAGFLMLAMGWVFLRRGRTGKPAMVLPAVVAGVWLLLLRLALEKAAAPGGMVWATGLSMALIPQGMLVGFAAGRRGAGFLKFLGALLVIGLLQRLAVIGVSWVATSQQLGTHLDMTPLKGFESAFVGTLEFATPMDAWWDGVLIPQLVAWVPATVILGLPLGALGWRLSRKRS